MYVINYYPHIQLAEKVKVNNPANVELFKNQFTIDVISE